jgi:LemA protein
MKKYFLNFIFIITAVSLLSSCGYNSMVTKEENVKSAWAQVENQYQRRMDLIPNLVATVQGYADFEQETLTKVIEARANATSTTIDANNLNEESLAKFQKNQDALSGALSRLMVVVERYPDLKANQNFRDLQVQLEGTENRIATERMNFNNSVRDYNAYIRRFPNNLIASMFGFQSKGYFEAKEGAEEVPNVEFGKRE